MLIDSHSHIDGAEFQLDIDEVFARMKEAEVGGALVAGTSVSYTHLTLPTNSRV